MREFQIIKVAEIIKEDVRIGFKKIWLCAGYDAGECAGYPGDRKSVV